MSLYLPGQPERPAGSEAVIPPDMVAAGLDEAVLTAMGVRDAETLRLAVTFWALGRASVGTTIRHVAEESPAEADPAAADPEGAEVASEPPAEVASLPESPAERLLLFPVVFDDVPGADRPAIGYGNPAGEALFELLEERTGVAAATPDRSVIESARRQGSLLRPSYREVVSFATVPESTYSDYTGFEPAAGIDDGPAVAATYFAGLKTEWMRLRAIVPLAVAKDVMSGMVQDPLLMRTAVISFIDERIAALGAGPEAAAERQKLREIKQRFIETLAAYFDKNATTVGILTQGIPGRENGLKRLTLPAAG